MNTYKLTQALVICEQLKNLLEKDNYCCGLTGSVLFENHSINDIDIILYPLKTLLDTLPPEEIITIIKDSKIFGEERNYNLVSYHEKDEKTVYFFANTQNQCFNLFFLK